MFKGRYLNEDIADVRRQAMKLGCLNPPAKPDKIAALALKYSTLCMHRQVMTSFRLERGALLSG